MQGKPNLSATSFQALRPKSCSISAAPAQPSAQSRAVSAPQPPAQLENKPEPIAMAATGAEKPFVAESSVGPIVCPLARPIEEFDACQVEYAHGNPYEDSAGAGSAKDPFAKRARRHNEIANWPQPTLADVESTLKTKSLEVEMLLDEERVQQERELVCAHRLKSLLDVVADDSGSIARERWEAVERLVRREAMHDSVNAAAILRLRDTVRAAKNG